MSEIKSVDDIENISFETVFCNNSFIASQAQRDLDKIYKSLWALCDEITALKKENKELKENIMDMTDKVNIMTDFMTMDENSKLKDEIKFIYEYLSIKATENK